LKVLIAHHIQDFQQQGGVCLLLYSLVLTRGMETIIEEGLGSSSLLCAGNGHCRHEIVNLILTGQAVPTLHNNDNKTQREVLGPGIRSRSEIGFIPPIENRPILGDYLKRPLFPIWVLLGKMHYTLVFGTDMDFLDSSIFTVNDKKGGDFTMYHFNGLSSLRWKENKQDCRGGRWTTLTIFRFDWKRQQANNDFVIQQAKWSCPRCTFANQPFHNQCQQCSFLKAKSSNDSKDAKTSVFKCKLDQRRYLFEVQMAPATQTWTCSQCTVANSDKTSTCVVCGFQNRLMAPWFCSICNFNNRTNAFRCDSCQAFKPAVDDTPYTCISCSVKNSPLIHPIKCGVCGVPRYEPKLCKWLPYEQLSPSVQKLAYDYLPDILTSLHTLWPNVSLTFTGDSPPSITT